MSLSNFFILSCLFCVGERGEKGDKDPEKREKTRRLSEFTALAIRSSQLVQSIGLSFSPSSPSAALPCLSRVFFSRPAGGIVHSTVRCLAGWLGFIIMPLRFSTSAPPPPLASLLAKRDRTVARTLCCSLFLFFSFRCTQSPTCIIFQGPTALPYSQILCGLPQVRV